MALRTLAAVFLLLTLVCAVEATAQSSTRRLVTIDALRQYPNYYHLQNVLLRGEFAEDGSRLLFRGGDREIRVLLNNVQTRSGDVEVRGALIDVGRLEPGDPRLGSYVTERADTEPWPRPGAELILTVSSVSEAAPTPTPTVRALALEPWKFEGQTVTITGNFRGRNLFGDAPDAPGKGRYDFILRGAEGAIWVVNQRPRGRGFDLDVERRMDTDKWLTVTGTVSRSRGLVMIEATKLDTAQAERVTVEEAAPPALPPMPAEVVFSSPTEGETEVPGTSVVRIQFSRGLREPTIDGRIRVSYLGAQPGSAAPAFRTAYDAATRSVELRFAQPLEAFRTVKVELLDGLSAFDNAPVRPWTLTFSIGE